MPKRFAIAWAVSRWSPVIIIVRIPADWATLIAAAASLRSGSIIPTKPAKIKSCSIESVSTVSGRVSITLYAIANTRSAWVAISLFNFINVVRSSSVNAETSPCFSIFVTRSNNISGAPLVATKYLPSSNWWIVVINLRVESNGTSAIRGMFTNSSRTS